MGPPGLPGGAGGPGTGRWGAQHSSDPQARVSACKSLALSARCPGPFAVLPAAHKRHSNERQIFEPETEPSPASWGSPGGSRALIWALIGFHLEICMLSLPAMAGPWGPARGAPGLTGKCGGVVLGQHLLTTLRTAGSGGGEVTNTGTGSWPGPHTAPGRGTSRKGRTGTSNSSLTTPSSPRHWLPSPQQRHSYPLLGARPSPGAGGALTCQREQMHRDPP